MEEKIEQAAKLEGQTTGTFDFKQKFIETQNLAIVCLFWCCLFFS